jgi:hypothetical protein
MSNSESNAVALLEPIQIIPDALYTDEALRLVLGLAESAIGRARRDGSLRCARRGSRNFYLGRWIMDWLTQAEASGSQTVDVVAAPEEPE